MIAVSSGRFCVVSVCVGQLALVVEHRDLAFANRQLAAILDLAVLHRIADCEHAGLVNPVDYVDQLLPQEITQTHRASSKYTPSLSGFGVFARADFRRTGVPDTDSRST